MPTVGIFADELCKALKIDYSDSVRAEKAFEDLCFEYGLELDEVTNAREELEKERGAEYVQQNLKDLLAEKGDDFERTKWKIDIPANRYDLLCIEGLVQSLQTYRGVIEPIQYKILKPSTPIQCFVKKEVADVRPYFIMAVLRNIKFTKASYDSFIDLQDKLHQNIGRRRQLVSMGTHDLDTIQGPFTYEALPPQDINFIPLKDPKDKADDGKHSYDAKTLLTGYKEHPQLKAYVPLIYDKPKYPVIYDRNRTVCSMPPIINSWHSRITMETKNVLLDVTGLDYTKCNIVLDTLCAMFSEHCAEPFTIEPVEMIIEDDYPKTVPFVTPGSRELYPKMAEKVLATNTTRMKSALALEHLSDSDVQGYLKKMMMPSEKSAKAGELNVRVPCTRSDVMHEVDLIEDLAISYGFMNLKSELPKMDTLIKDQPINRLTDMIRQECAGAGFNECLTFALCSKEDCFQWFRKEFSQTKLEEAAKIADKFTRTHQYEPLLPPVLLSNPKAKEYNMARTSLLPGLLKTMDNNKKNPLPIKLFEISDCVIQDLHEETGARNQRRCAALVCSQASSFETIHGLIDHLMYKLNFRAQVEVDENELRRQKGDTSVEKWKGKIYELVHMSDPSFIDGMCGSIVADGIKIGIAGVLRPDVLDPAPVTIEHPETKDKTVIRAPWSIRNPCTVVELNLGPFIDWLEQ